MLSFLDREVSVAPPGFSRWLVPPAALSIHLASGQVYSFSIFKNPLLALRGVDGAVWSLKEVGYLFSIAIAMLESHDVPLDSVCSAKSTRWSNSASVGVRRYARRAKRWRICRAFSCFDRFSSHESSIF